MACVVQGHNGVQCLKVLTRFYSEQLQFNPSKKTLSYSVVICVFGGWFNSCCFCALLGVEIFSTILIAYIIYIHTSFLHQFEGINKSNMAATKRSETRMLRKDTESGQNSPRFIQVK